jgi:hypothetical protein
MSNSLAIAAVTTTLQSILFKGVTTEADLNDTTVTTLPLDRARGNNSNNQLNLFLYQIARNAAWANRPMPGQVQSGETGIPPLPLNLYYLLTAFGRDNDALQPLGHQLLGKAMSIMHDHPVLSSDEIRAATIASIPGNDLDRQLERIRITFQPLTLEDISKLWTGFATQYRLSAAYEVEVALIESTRPSRTPLPTLTRGPNDSGVTSQPDLSSPLPSLNQLTLPNNQPSARLNDILTLGGNHLDGTNIGAVFNHRLWTAPIDVGPLPGGTPAQVQVRIPNAPAVWPAGFYTVALMVQRPGESYRRPTNELSFSIAPAMTIAPAAAPAGDITYSATCTPEIKPEQRASLLLGDQVVIADLHALQTNILTFGAKGVSKGAYFVRLRVDGVDSLLINRAVTPPVFDQTQKVTVT